MIVSAFTIEELYCVKTSIQIIILVSLRKHHCHSNEFTNRQPYECNMIQIPTPHVILVLKEIRQHSKKKTHQEEVCSCTNRQALPTKVELTPKKKETHQDFSSQQQPVRICVTNYFMFDI